MPTPRRGGRKSIPNAWFVGLARRRNPDIVGAVLWKNGDWGSNSAKLAAQVIDAYINKQPQRANNLPEVATPSTPETPANSAPPKALSPPAAE